MTLNEIYIAALLSKNECSLMPDYISGEKEFYGTPAFEKLYEYFGFVICEMPYGIAKCRTGCPDEWIIEKLEDIPPTNF